MRKKRRKVGLSLRELGEKIELSHTFLHQVEQGRRAPIPRSHWAALVDAIPGLTRDELERAAAEDRPLALDLADAPPHVVDVAVAMARRLAGGDLDLRTADALLAVLDEETATGRAFGRVVDRGGKPVTGKAFLYRIATGSGWAALLGVREQAGRSDGPSLARVARDTGKTVELMKAGHPQGGGFFDVPGGLPLGEYALHVHHAGKQEWAWPLVVSTGAAQRDVPIGGPDAAS
ncbi:MAG: helix-turn-helix domain-containing protein [Deltaproteobacteria bacterium]|nr:helix-turn-helix domain-containing protein [Deltaproteobacteria bacterium]